MKSIGEQVPTSPRNIVAGLIGEKEKIFLCEYIDFQAFDIVEKYNLLNSETDLFPFLKNNNFSIPSYSIIKRSRIRKFYI